VDPSTSLDGRDEPAGPTELVVGRRPPAVSVGAAEVGGGVLTLDPAEQDPVKADVVRDLGFRGTPPTCPPRLRVSLTVSVR